MIAKRQALFYLLIFLSFIGRGQVIQVLDSENGFPISDVTIYAESQQEFTYTDINGNADISAFSMDDHLVFQHPTYKGYTISKLGLKKDGYRVKLTPTIIEMGEIIISANKWEQQADEIPNEIIPITPKTISFNNPQTSADLLEGTGKVFVQKSQLGGGSPMLRGFGANAVLIVVDGVRMNNAVFRGGNLQNIINIDPNVLQGAEVILGPGSVIYGSDALGGVMDFHTKNIILHKDDQLLGNGFLRYSTANKEKTGHANWMITTEKIGYFGGITFSNYEDLRAGNNRPDGYPDFGKREYYVKTIGGQDTIIKNPDYNIQIPSGYSQYNIIQKLKWETNSSSSLEYIFNLSNTNDVPRYDRLIEEDENGLPVYAEWYYGPQFWMMNALKYNSENKSLWDDLSLTFALQDFKESRNDRRYENDVLRTRTEKVEAYSINADANKLVGKSELFYGLEYAHNQVNSTASQVNLASEEQSPLSTRYPNGGSQTHSLGTYLNWKLNVLEDRFYVNGGMRYNYYHLLSKLDREDFPFDEIKNQNHSVNGNLGLVFQSKHSLRLNILGTTGFRAPNVDDVAKIFDSEPGSVVVPNPRLKPEYSYNTEAGIHWQPFNNFSISSTFYYSWLTDAMVRDDFTFNGQDSIIYDGEMSKVQAMVNTGKARIYGIDFHLNWEFSDNWGIESYLNLMKSEDLTNGESLRHTTPAFGKTSLFFQKRKTKIELYSRYNGKISYDNLPPSEKNKPHNYTSAGSLAWATYNVRAKYQLSGNINIDAAIENLLDKHYRTYSSGISAPGINFILSVKANF